MLKEIKIKNNKKNIILASVLLFFVLAGTLLINGIIHNTQAQWAIIPDIRLVGEYKIGDGEWNPIVEGNHIPATKGDVHLRGMLNICEPETKEFFGYVDNGSLMLFTLNHINLSVANDNQIISISDTENPDAGEDFAFIL